MLILWNLVVLVFWISPGGFEKYNDNKYRYCLNKDKNWFEPIKSAKKYRAESDAYGDQIYG